MEFKLVHLYPNLMNLYGSYANVSVLKTAIERAGHTAQVIELKPEEEADKALIRNADFIYMGAGTERSANAALNAAAPIAELLRGAMDGGVPMLFAGTAMELLGSSITDADGTEHEGLKLAAYKTIRTEQRHNEDVLGLCPAVRERVVGFINKASTTVGVVSPFLTELSMGFGNESKNGPEGFMYRSLIASQLTGPLLVKNPQLLRLMCERILNFRGVSLPADWAPDTWAVAGYEITERELGNRCQSK